MYLGIDVGGTHTDAVLCSAQAVHAFAKVKTHAADVALSIREALSVLQEKMPTAFSLSTVEAHSVQRVTLSTTLGLNAMIQGKASPVGLLYTAGPGMDPQRFLQNSIMNRYAHRVEGGLDHRGCEVSPLQTEDIAQVLQLWQEAGIQHFAIAGKFSVRNAVHEKIIAAELIHFGIPEENITLSHTLSGKLHFPRRMAAAYINASIQKVQQDFLRAVYAVLQDFSLHAPVYLLKADGGAIPFENAYAQPLHTVLSGPAASVMGAMVLGENSLAKAGDALLLDVGGTTTDIAVYAAGLPVLDAHGMSVHVPTQESSAERDTCFSEERLLTPMRSLATLSLALGGDSPMNIEGQDVKLQSVRHGAAMAFGGKVPTLADALMVLTALEAEHTPEAHNDTVSKEVQASLLGVEAFAQQHGIEMRVLAEKAIFAACEQIKQGIESLLARLAEQPVYTLAQLLHGHVLQPKHICLVGGPAVLLRTWLAPYMQETLGMQVYVPKQSAYANALGAAMTLPTAHVELLADTLQGFWQIPTLGLRGAIDRRFTVDDAIVLAQEALEEQSAFFSVNSAGTESFDIAMQMDITEAESFATLDMSGRGGKDIRVLCQWRPGIVAALSATWE